MNLQKPSLKGLESHSRSFAGGRVLNTSFIFVCEDRCAHLPKYEDNYEQLLTFTPFKLPVLQCHVSFFFGLAWLQVYLRSHVWLTP